MEGGDRVTAKEFLDQARKADMAVNSKFEQVQRLRELASHTTAAYGGEVVSHSLNVDTMSNAVMRIMDAEQRLDDEIDHMLVVKEQVQAVISRVDNFEQRILLEHRYLNYHSWEEIAIEMNYSLRWVYKQHGAALQVVGQILSASVQ